MHFYNVHNSYLYSFIIFREVNEDNVLFRKVFNGIRGEL